MRTGEVASAAGVNVQTLRYYERRGLLPEPGRSLGGHRAWSPEAVTAVRMIKLAQRLGFTLDEAAALLGARKAGLGLGGRRPGVGRLGRAGLRESASTKLAELDAKIAALTRTRAVLSEAVEAGCDDLSACSAHPECPIPFR